MDYCQPEPAACLANFFFLKLLAREIFLWEFPALKILFCNFWLWKFFFGGGGVFGLGKFSGIWLEEFLAPEIFLWEFPALGIFWEFLARGIVGSRNFLWEFWA